MGLVAIFQQSRQFLEQLIIGGEDGQISVIDAGSKQNTDSILLSYQTKYPILQMDSGEFLPSIMKQTLAVLSPAKLSFYRLQYEKSDESRVSIEEVFSHSLQSSAWNMCKINTPDSPLQILVQSVDCKLSLYEGDQCVFSNCPLRALHPGPITFSPNNSALYVANNGLLASIKFSLLSSGSQKRINFDWSLNLGDTALQMELVDGKQMSLVVLCRRHLTCATESGTIRWQIRLEAVGTAMCSYKNLLSTDYQNVRTIVATSDDNLLIFNEEKLNWNCNAQMVPVCMKVSSYNKLYECMITMLSADGKVVIGYLGTEPNLYKVPTETKIINFAEKMEQFKALEQSIRENDSTPSSAVNQKGIDMKLTIGEKGKRTIEHNSANNVPYCNVDVSFNRIENINKLHINIQSELATPNKQITLNASAGNNFTTLSLPFYIGAGKLPTSSKVTILAHCFHSQISCVKSINLPLDLIFHESGVDRNSKYRITLDTDAPLIPLNKLFPETGTENPNSIGLQVHGNDANVSIFMASKSNRYRVQSEHMCLLQMICAELTNRIQRNVQNVQIGALIPFEYISEVVDSINDEEAKKEEDKKRINCRMKEVRSIEALSLNMSKSGKLTNLSHIDALFDKSYRELLTYMENYNEKSKKIALLCSTLGSLFQLAADLSKQNKVDTIINGNFYVFTHQKLKERLQWASKTDRGDEMKLIEKLCEHSNKELPKIKEEDEENEG